MYYHYIPVMSGFKLNLSRFHIVHYDATDYTALPKFIEEVQKIVGEKGVNLLINNAGAAGNGFRTFEETSPDKS